MCRLLPAFLMLLSIFNFALPVKLPASDFGLDLPAPRQSGRLSAQEWLPAGETVELGGIPGPGAIRHFWMTFNRAPETTSTGLDLILRVYTDRREAPDVEIPVSAFFAQFHGREPARIQSPYLRVTAQGGFNSYFPMPFGEEIRLTLENQAGRDLDVYFQADYHLFGEDFSERRRFRTQYRRANPARRYGRPYFIGAGQGPGILAGVALGMTVSDRTDAWYHGGGDLILLDGKGSAPSVLHGIGGEDLFGTAFGMEPFSNGPVGSPYYIVSENAPDFIHYRGRTAGQVTQESTKAGNPYLIFSAYRFFDPETILFQDSFWMGLGTFANSVTSVLYAYQEAEPATGPLPLREARRMDAEVSPDVHSSETTWEICGPFPAGTRLEFVQKRFPEEKIDFKHTEPANFGVYQTAVDEGLPQMKTRWIQGVPEIGGFVHLSPYFHPRLPTNFAQPKETAAYALRTIEADAAETARLRLTHDDWLRIWLNGDLVYDGEKKSGFQTAEVVVELKEGENQILVKAANLENINNRAWLFALSLAE